MDTSSITNPVDAHIQLIAQTITEWKSKTDEKALKQKVFTKLDASVETILLKLLGFDNKWSNGWELDHCNGRNGNSAAGDFIAKHQEEAIKEWLSQVALPRLSPKVTASIKASCAKDYQYYFEQRLRERCIKKAQEDADALLADICKPNQLNNYLKTLELIGAPAPKDEY